LPPCVVIFRTVTPCNVNFSFVLIFVTLINFRLCEHMYSAHSCTCHCDGTHCNMKQLTASCHHPSSDES
jgi:hypothetical protein